MRSESRQARSSEPELTARIVIWSNMMKRLTGLDGVTLHGETSVMPTHVLAVLFCDPAIRGELTARAVLRLLAERTAATKSFPQRLLTNPFGRAQPVWVEDPAFTVHDHLHHVRLPKPGTLRELAALVDQLHAQPLDRDRPLWDAWVVQGLTDGRLVVVMKFAHAMADGVGAVSSMLPRLMTTDQDAKFPAVPERAPTPTPAPLRWCGTSSTRSRPTPPAAFGSPSGWPPGRRNPWWKPRCDR